MYRHQYCFTVGLHIRLFAAKCLKVNIGPLWNQELQHQEQVVENTQHGMNERTGLEV